jgi:hypothetical protein
LQQRELVGRKRVTGNEFRRVLVALHRHRVADEGELVVDDVTLLFEAIAQGDVASFGLGQQAFADNFVGIGTGQRQTGMEAPLNL